MKKEKKKRVKEGEELNERVSKGRKRGKVRVNRKKRGRESSEK